MTQKPAPKLFAVYLGGRAPKANTELHDVVFAVGDNIEDTYEQLMDQWFGTPAGLHLDSWLELDNADGHEITLTEAPPANGKRLYFINVGAYADGQFTELHANTFIVAEDSKVAKSRGKAALASYFTNTLSSPIHTDDLHAIDDCLELVQIGPYFINLKPTNTPQNLRPTNGYHLVPKGLVEDYLRRKA